MPYRTPDSERAVHVIERGELIERYELREHPRPFSSYDQNGVSVTTTDLGLKIRLETEKWSKAFLMEEYPRSDMVVSTEFSLGSVFQGEVVLEVRNFKIGDLQLGYRMIVSPAKRRVEILKFAGKNSHRLASSSAIDALKSCTSRNHLELRARGKQLVALVNDECVALVNDRSFGFGCSLIRFDPGGAKDVDFFCYGVELFEVL